MLKLATFLLFIIVPSFTSASPSFYCDDPDNTVETFICSNLFISDLDNRLTKTYRFVLKEKPKIASKVKKQQRKWIKKRNNCVNDYQGKDSFSSCVKYLYNTRIEALEKILPGKQNETISRNYYRRGNKTYKSGDYYKSIYFFTRAYEVSDNYIDKLRALGAMAYHSKRQGNYALAARYAQKILEIDSTSEFASNIIEESETDKNDHEYSNNQYSLKSNANVGNNDCIGTCFIKALGTEACDYKAKELAKSSFNTEAYGFITGPSCEIVVSNLLGTKATDRDIALAAITGALFDANIDSDDDFENVLGYLAKGTAVLIKVAQINECTEQCN